MTPAIIALIIFGFILAAWLQVLQLILPSRDAAIGDVFWNIAGIAMALPRRVHEAIRASIRRPVATDCCPVSGLLAHRRTCTICSVARSPIV